jgi:hypothetical protein
MPAENPYPGMNPYLEARWGDVHSRLIIYSCDQMQAQLPESLRARVEERVWIEDPDHGQPGRSVYPDVSISQRSGNGAAAAETENGGVAVAEPIVFPIRGAEVVETYLEIIDVKTGGRVVTTIEFLSPANKTAGPGRDLYLQKQEDMIRGGVNLVVIDLLRQGDWVLPVEPRRLEKYGKAAYRTLVRRATGMQYEYYRMPLRSRLLAIRIPLRRDDADVRLDLQALVNQAYVNGRHDDIDYRREPDPPLDTSDVEWNAQLLSAKTLRS